jgi:hypothetical protein
MDRRAVFFFIASAAGFGLAPVCDAEYRWVAIAVGVTYLVLAVAVLLESWSKARRSPES